MVPDGFAVVLHRGSLAISGPTDAGSARFHLDAVTGQPGNAVENLRTAVLGVLNFVQDFVARSLRQPWPNMEGTMPLPECDIEDGVLTARFGALADNGIYALVIRVD